ncbi:hypothetical protein ACFJGV_11985 [Cnuibacter sp. UC19_7]|uniref:hypothetical protein n=1 Tax=Cnuibacter sp. UC19_7 TaxID=3350166 RepID=UPI00366E1C7F
MDLFAALGAGLLAGLALVLPLGAIGVLLLREGATCGLARGAAAALAVAAVDVLYCAAAVAIGTASAPLVATWAPWPQVLGGAALLAIAARGFAHASRTPTAEEGAGPCPHSSRSGRRFILFVGLTAINPATLLYFTAMVAGPTAVASSPSAAAFFIAGVGLASATWQLLLVAAGALVSRTAGPRFARATTLIGNTAVAALGALMIAEAITRIPS